MAAPAMVAANIPRKSPDFAISLNNGTQVKLNQYQGKVVALVFVLTSCPHCQKAVQYLIRDQNEFGPRGFQALASVVEDMAQINLPEFVRQFKPGFPVGYNQLRPVLDFMQHPPMVGPRMPLIAFLDRRGVIRAQYEGHEAFFEDDQMERNIREKILELLNEAAPPAKKKVIRRAGPKRPS